MELSPFIRNVNFATSPAKGQWQIVSVQVLMPTSGAMGRFLMPPNTEAMEGLFINISKTKKPFNTEAAFFIY
jgi:hypothetical protein